MHGSLTGAKPPAEDSVGGGPERSSKGEGIMACPYCNQSLPEQFKFCPSCRHQVKCRNPECGSSLLANVPICVECGTDVVSGPANGAAQSRFLREIKQT